MNTKTLMFLKLMLVSALFCCFSGYIFSNQTNKKDSLIWNVKNASGATAKITANFGYGSYLKFTNSDSALIYINKSLSMAENLKDERFIMKANNELGIIYWQKGEYKKAQIYLNNAFKAGEKFKDTLILISARYNMGNINITQGNYEAALANFNKVLKYIGTSDSTRLAQTYNAFGNIYLYQSDYVKALEYYSNSANILEKGTSSKDLALSYNNMGIIYYYQDQFDKALSFYQKSLEIKESIKDKKGVSDCLNNIAIIHDEMGNTDRAFKFYNKAIVLLTELGNKQGLASTYSNLGDLERKSKNYDKAENLFNTALKIQEEIGDKRGITYSLTGLGEMCYFKNNNTDAISYFKRAIVIGQEINARKELLSIYEKLKDIYIEQKEYQLAANFYKFITRLQKEIFNSERLQKLNDIQARYETKAREKEIVILKANKRLKELELKQKDIEVNKQKTVTLFLSIGFGIFIIFMIVIVRLYFGKRKSNKILAFQKEEISQQKEELQAQSELLSTTNKSLEKKNLQITDSINYAQKIQQAIFPEINNINNDLVEIFALFKPKDIVSGDFYWHVKIDNYTFIAVVDCTGHGVPGAFMSIIGNNLLNEIIIQKRITNPSEIINNLDIGVKNMLMNNLSEQRLQDDGMEISLCRINTENRQIIISNSNQCAYLYNNGELAEVEGCLYSVGGVFTNNKTFINNEFTITNQAIVYLFTDGFQDQFGGEKNKKYGSVRFQELIKSVSKEKFSSQYELLDNELTRWKGNNFQIDDVCVLGIKIN
ncbi:MAG: hypothetical protein A2046_12440 [Bacteroidetes bacterium GWA2_30_7]|nr:MAG: hypothetical protein A2046_12440 [Bacteroidetes bacterium GWA2_30_7]